MTAKEALEKLLNTPDYEGEPIVEGLDINDVNIVRQALTPPTAEEVCKLLAQYYEIKNEDLLFYRSRTKTFIYDTELVGIEEELVWLNEEGNIEMLNPMKPNITTEIGKFYESLEEK